jgi:hypothetical protein
MMAVRQNDGWAYDGIPAAVVVFLRRKICHREVEILLLTCLSKVRPFLDPSLISRPILNLVNKIASDKFRQK